MHHLKRLALWFTNGVALALGIAMVAWISSRIGEAPQTVLNTPQYPPDSVQLSAVEVIPFAEALTIAANLSSQDKSNVAVEVELVVTKDAQVAYTCPAQSFTYKRAGQPQRIQVECRSLKRSNLPDGAATELRVRRVAWLPT